MKKVIRKLGTNLLIFPVRIYQTMISPLTPASCRHIPTCSEYTTTALKLHGPVIGGKLAMNRIMRCHPWGTSGFDPVPLILLKKIDLKKKYKMKEKLKTSDRLKHGISAFTLLFLSLMLFSLSACSRKQKPVNEKIQILVSILPNKYFVEKIGGDLVHVDVLIPPGANLQSYDPSPRQMQNIEKTAVYFYNGQLTFESHFLPVIKNNYPDIKLVQMTTGIELISGDDHDHEGYQHENKGVDPHTWLSVRNGMIIAANITKTLTEYFPDHKDTFLRNYDNFSKELNLLDQKLEKMFTGMKNRKFIIYHPALGYFARDYGLQQISIEQEGKEPTPLQLKNMIDLAREDAAKVVFIQKEFDKENARIVAEEIDGEVVQIDPLAENWDENLLKIANLIQSSNK